MFFRLHQAKIAQSSTLTRASNNTHVKPLGESEPCIRAAYHGSWSRGTSTRWPTFSVSDWRIRYFPTQSTPPPLREANSSSSRRDEQQFRVNLRTDLSIFLFSRACSDRSVDSSSWQNWHWYVDFAQNKLCKNRNNI